MSYLMLPDGVPNFGKAVISLWFRAPKQAVIKASKSAIDAGSEGFFMMQSILPLVTFGKQQSTILYSTPLRDVAVIHPYIPGEPEPTTTYMAPYYVEAGSYKVDPCYVGLLCREDGKFNIVFHIQMGDRFIPNASGFITTKMDIWAGSDPTNPDIAGASKVPGSGVVGMFPNVGIATIEDASYVDAAQPAWFEVQSEKTFDPDEWHHILVSFDVSGTASIGTPFASSNCKLWYAIDDEDYRGAKNMGPYRDTAGQWGHDNLDPNAIIPYSVWRLSGLDPDWQALQYYQNQHVGLPSGTYTPTPIPTNKELLGFPADSRYVDGIFHVEMAEFLMFTGITLDTSKEENRRLFITEKDKKGRQYPVNPSPTTVPISRYAVGDPATWEPGAADVPAIPPRLDPTNEPTTVAIPPGTKPPRTAEVDFTKSSLNWILGRNLGTAKGKREIKGKIKEYFPDPVLEDTSGS